MNMQRFTPAPSDCYQRSQSIVLSSWWNHICDHVITLLFQPQELVVTEKQTANGSFWQIYDPNTGQSVDVRSRQEAILWIEQHHLQSPKPALSQFRH